MFGRAVEDKEEVSDIMLDVDAYERNLRLLRGRTHAGVQ